MKALILAAGFGVRLREMIHGRPKVMAPIKDKPFLEYLILQLKKQRIKDIVLAVGYLSDYIRDYFGDGKKWNVKINYSVDNSPLGTAGTIRYALSYFKKDFLTINGDTYLDINFNKFFEFHFQKKADVTLAVTKKFQGRGGYIALDKNKRIKEFKAVAFKKEKLITGFNNAGAYIFKPEIFKFLKRGEKASLEKDFFPLLIKKKYRLYGYPIKTYLDIGSPFSYQQAIKILKKREKK